MKTSELIGTLLASLEANGDLDVIVCQGEMDDPYPVVSAKVVNVDKRGSEEWPDYIIRDDNVVTNARAVEVGTW